MFDAQAPAGKVAAQPGINAGDEFDGRVASLIMDVNAQAGLFPGYELKLNSYDLGVDIELYDAIQRLRFEHPEIGAKAPGAFGGSPISLHLYVPDVDAAVAKAESTGGTVKQRPETKFYGDRMGTVADPFGHIWHLATHVEDVPHDEIQRRMAAQT